MTQPSDRSRHANSKRKTSRVLIAEDDTEMRSMLAEALRAEGYLCGLPPGPAKKCLAVTGQFAG